MPTTQRLLTDETGQALVTAVNNIVAAVKPNATEIQMSSSDTTTVATAITNINNKIGTVPSGQTVESQITTLNSNISKFNPIDNSNVYTGDLNDLDTSGNYLSTDGTNRPGTGWWNVYVSRTFMDNSGYVLTQTAVKASGAVRVFIRTRNGSTWTSWVELAKTSDARVKYTSTESFQAIDPYVKTSSSYLGGSLDSKIHSQISSLPTGMSMQTVSNNSGPVYGAILNKTNNSAYAGIVWSYHESARNTAWLFVYYNSTFILRPLAEEIN